MHWHEYIIGSRAPDDRLTPALMPPTRKDPATTDGAANDPGHPGADPVGGSDASRDALPGALWQRFEVPFSFPVVFTHDLFDPTNALLADALGRLEPAKRQRFAVVVDAGLAEADPGLVPRVSAWSEAQGARVELLGEPVVAPGGEALKNDPGALGPLYRLVHERGIDRHSALVGIGGGALLDAVGLVAATSHRGVRHVRVPTTVLAQNDSGVGVKNGVNRFGQKNWCGTFAPPFAVINDSAFLALLGERDRRAGLAEAVKVALIRDRAFFERLERDAHALVRFEPRAVAHAIERCAELHMHQIGHGGDPFELGSARPLDFGHWAAHRLETLTGHRLRHGEAVAIGIALDARYSTLAGLLEAEADERIAALLETLGFRLWDDALDALEPDGASALLAGLEHFRTHLGGRLTITLLAAIGRGEEVHRMQAARVLESVDWLRARA